MNLVGLESDPSKIVIQSSYMTFCSLCQRKVEKSEECYSWVGSKFIVHLNCELARDRMHLVEFRKTAKNRGRARRGKKKNEKVLASQNPGRAVPVRSVKNYRDIAGTR